MTAKENRDSSSKDRFCADRHNQRDNTPKEEEALYTVNLYYIIITYETNAHDKQDMVVVDLSGAYLSAKTMI